MFELWVAILAIGVLGLEYIAVRAYYRRQATAGRQTP
jgi:positive regulator of sigma E activity